VALIENLAGIHERFGELDKTLRSLLAEHEQFDFRELAQVLAKLREQTGVLAELSPILGEPADLPEGSAMHYAAPRCRSRNSRLRWQQEH